MRRIVAVEIALENARMHSIVRIVPEGSIRPNRTIVIAERSHDRQTIRIERNFHIGFECIQLVIGRMQVIVFFSGENKPNTLSYRTVQSLAALRELAGHDRAKMMHWQFCTCVKELMFFIIWLKYRHVFGVKR
jgi:hypothetical protein